MIDNAPLRETLKRGINIIELYKHFAGKINLLNDGGPNSFLQ
jgi:hypothetical protein